MRVKRHFVGRTWEAKGRRVAYERDGAPGRQIKSYEGMQGTLGGMLMRRTGNGQIEKPRRQGMLNEETWARIPLGLIIINLA